VSDWLTESKFVDQWAYKFGQNPRWPPTTIFTNKKLLAIA